MLETVRRLRAAPITLDSAALNAVLVSVRILVAIKARKLAVSSRRFVQGIICSASLNTIVTRPSIA